MMFPRPEEVELAGIRPADYNPRRMPDEEMRALKASMREHGMVLNLVVQRESDGGVPNVLIGGHQRLRAMREMCEEGGEQLPETVWATVLDVGDDEAKRLNVALNKISGEFDEEMLADLWSGILGGVSEEEIEATGFSPEQVEALVGSFERGTDETIAALEMEAEQISRDWSPTPTLTVDFDTKELRDEAKARLKELAGDRRTGDALLGLLRAGT